MEQLIKQLEENRLNFLKLFKKTKTVNIIVLAIIIAAMGATFLFLFDVNQNLSLIIIVILIVAMYAYSRYTKSWLGKKTYDYIYSYYRLTSSYFYAERPFYDIEVLEQEGFDVAEFQKLGVLLNVKGIISRNTIKGKIGSVPFQVADAGVRVERNKKLEVAFFGKIFKLDFVTPIVGRFIIHRRFDDKQPLPDGFNNLTSIDDSDAVLIIGTEATLPKAIKKTLITKFKRLRLDEDLVDATLIILENTAYLLLSYGDSIMNVVYEKEVDDKPFVRFEDDLRIIAEISDDLPK